MGNLDDILTERAGNYGDFRDQARISQELKCVAMMASTSYWPRMKPYQKEATEMILHKLARILSGNPNYADSWVDIAGYATLVAEKIQQDQGD